MRIENIMTRQPVCCSPGDSLRIVAEMMRQNDVGAIPVVSDQVSKRLLGIITDRDICVTAIAAGKDPHTTPVAEFYTRDVVTCFPDDTLAACELKMKEHKVRRIPVVDRENCCVGIVVQADIARVERPEGLQELLAEISKPNVFRARMPVGVA